MMRKSAHSLPANGSSGGGGVNHRGLLHSTIRVVSSKRHRPYVAVAIVMLIIVAVLLGKHLGGGSDGPGTIFRIDPKYGTDIHFLWTKSFVASADAFEGQEDDPPSSAFTKDEGRKIDEKNAINDKDDNDGSGSTVSTTTTNNISIFEELADSVSEVMIKKIVHLLDADATSLNSFAAGEGTTHKHRHPIFYLTTEAIPAFILDVLPLLEKRFASATSTTITTTSPQFVLVSGCTDSGPLRAIKDSDRFKLHLKKKGKETIEDAAAYERIIFGHREKTTIAKKAQQQYFNSPAACLRRFLESPLLRSWYAQNCDFDHQKMRCVPIGIDFHTQTKTKAWWGKQQTAFSQDTALFELSLKSSSLFRMGSSTTSSSGKEKESTKEASTSGRAGRTTAEGEEAQQQQKREVQRWLTGRSTRVVMDFSSHSNKLVRGGLYMKFFHKSFVNVPFSSLARADLWDLYSNSAFVMSPPGNGYDCHRTWEALALGAIPIVLSAEIAQDITGAANKMLFDKLPVVIVDDYDEVTEANLNGWRDEFVSRAKRGEFDVERLFVGFWLQVIRGGATREVASSSL